jgi:hypothetical protein
MLPATFIVVQLPGVTRSFVQESYVGGRVMMANNEMQRVIAKKIADYDGVSLFPSAMAELYQASPLASPPTSPRRSARVRSWTPPTGTWWKSP